VYSDGDAHAIYHATLHPDETAPHMDLAIGISGSWDVEDSVADVSGFLRVWPTATDINLRFVDPTESEWSSARMLAHQLTATAARESGARSELLRIAELVIDHDAAVNHHLRHAS
jgi:hypothetical protein